MANISVKGAGDNRKIVLWEKDDAHPDGEVVISNDGTTHTVAETAAVKRLVAEGALVKVEGSKVAPASAPKTDDKK